MWEKIKLKKAVNDFISGGSPDTKNPELWAGNIPWIAGADIDEEVKLGKSFINERAIQGNATHIVPKGALLVVTRTGVGKMAIAPENLATSQDIIGIVPKDSFKSKYLLYSLKSQVNNLLVCQRGATIKEIIRKDLEKIDIPFISLSEQVRIIEILDQADELRKMRAEADTKAAKILPTLFYKMFGDPTINPKGLKKNKLGKLLKVKSGKFLPSSEMDAKGQYPVYGGNGINGFHSRYMFEHPMIVLGRVGAYCGATYYTKPKCWVTDNALYVAEHSEELHPRYLTEALRIANLNQYAGRAGQPLISGSRIYPIEILVPDMIKQEIFVKNIESIVKYEKQREETEKYLQDLFSTLNHHAFSGDLTAKWRDAHMKELLAEMEIQKKHLNTKII